MAASRSKKKAPARKPVSAKSRAASRPAARKSASAKSRANPNPLGLEKKAPDQFDTLQEIANLLYYGPWVAERVVGARSIYEAQPEALLPVIRKVLDVHQRFTAVDTFAAQYRLQALQQHTAALDSGIGMVQCRHQPLLDIDHDAHSVVGG